MGISEQSKASKHRLEDAYALLNAGRWHGAMYMSGYAVECLIKTKLMRIYGCRNLYELEYELQRRAQLATHATVFTHHLFEAKVFAAAKTFASKVVASTNTNF